MAGKNKSKEVPEKDKEVKAPAEGASEENGGPDLAVELAEAREQLQEAEDKVLRLAADFDNSKKRLERERGILLKYAEENVLRELLPGIDNLERAMAQGQETGSIDSLLAGVELTINGLLETLGRFGVEPINSVGEAFDPNIHEAIAMEPSADLPQNIVIRELQKGYIYKERLLRAAKVIVSSGPAA